MKKNNLQANGEHNIILMNDTSLLHDTVLNPPGTYAKIIDSYDALTPGAEMVISNDSDPKPLYYELLNHSGHVFTWEYLVKGPDLWSVKITKHQPDKQTVTLGQMAAKDYRNAQIFSKYGLNFCCNGKKTLAQACEEKNISATPIEKELLALKNHSHGMQLNYQDWHPAFMIDFIINNHHQYLRRSLKPLQDLAIKVAKSHGIKHPKLLKVATIFGEVALEAEHHMRREEGEVFPYIKNLVQLSESFKPEHAGSGLITRLLSRKEIGHEDMSEKMRLINELTDNYEVPAGACVSYTLLLKWLNEFETDLQLHTNLESNILFGKAIEIENNLS